MIIILKKNLSEAAVNAVMERLKWMQLEVVPQVAGEHIHLAIVRGALERIHFYELEKFPEVEKVLPFTSQFKLGSKTFKSTPTIIEIKGRKIGDGSCMMMAGPCSIESEQQIHEIAALVAKSGASALRGGAFKPRTSPYEFQGLGEVGLRYMRAAADANHLLSISEVMDIRDVALVAEYVDIVQVGARNMQNFSLLKELGTINKPIMLKRGLCATYVEWLMAAEYIASCGNSNIMLCERGIRTFETYTRNTLDLAAVPVLKDLTHFPVIVDPSHGTGLRALIAPMSYAAAAVGADGLIIEVHTQPDQSVSDAKQAIHPETFTEIVKKVRAIKSIE